MTADALTTLLENSTNFWQYSRKTRNKGTGINRIIYCASPTSALLQAMYRESGQDAAWWWWWCV